MPSRFTGPISARLFEESTPFNIDTRHFGFRAPPLSFRDGLGALLRPVALRMVSLASPVKKELARFIELVWVKASERHGASGLEGSSRATASPSTGRNL